MALPVTPIPLVAVDEIIEASWGNQVAQSLNNLVQGLDYIFWKPDTEYLAANSSTMGAWFRVGGSAGEITVPDWAGHIVAEVQMNGVYLTAQAAVTYDLQLQIGSLAGRTIRRTGIQTRDRTDADHRDWFNVSWTDRFSVGDLSGDRAVRVYAGRFNGANRWAVDATSDVAVLLTFQGAIG